MDSIPTFFFSWAMIFYVLEGKGVCKCVKNIWKYALSQNVHDSFCVFQTSSMRQIVS
jgi:hypothetical protein